MYQFLVSFAVPSVHRDAFVAAAQKTARDSVANEEGSIRLELLVDEQDPGTFYLNETYASAEAFSAHAAGPHFTEFFATASGLAEGPVWLMKGNTIQQSA